MHSWWYNPALNTRSAIPRHTEIKDILAKKICKDLGVDPNEITITAAFKHNALLLWSIAN